ncbi:MAG: HPr family phosphocarrier protein [Christensenellales bacterium]|jgi:phosphocarrier protein HPr
MLHKVITINNQEGLRSRPAAMFVQTAGEFQSQIYIEVGNKRINGKSIIGLLSLNLQRGDAVRLLVTGEDEKEAMAAIVKLVEANFDPE